ncbi:MAG TPA: tRNA pseudouridine(13) synthase TruD [Marinobacter sp.]|nr:tRNA pseudouridine(13) synthase TruD [Marinobacter sp.]
MADTPNGSQWRLDWPVSGGARIAAGKLKSCPDDFRVSEEVEGFPENLGQEAAPGGGEHLCLYLEKTGDNTEYVARELAVLSGCRSFDVGFCGLKDRHAVTRQWFSLYRPGQEAEDSAFIAEVSARWPVLSSYRHSRKLRRGDHRGNHFVITLRDIAGSRTDIDNALNRLKAQGAPNYFGPQRFGIDGGNLDRAATMNPAAMGARGRSGGRGRKGKRPAAGDASKSAMYFSAARSWLFNEVLACRINDKSWLSLIDGEPGLAGETVPTGPLWGDGGTSAGGSLAELERGIVGQTPEFVRLFSATRMKPERRSLISRPGELKWTWPKDNCLELAFFLTPGQYATTILSDIFELEDISLGQHKKHED